MGWTDGGDATDALPLLCFRATLRLKDRFVYGQQTT
jgi:hypothetical protein